MAERLDACWQEVACSNCGKRYTCTPGSDYYNNTTLEDGVCERCLLNGHRGANPPQAEMTPLLKGAIDSGLVSLSPELAAEMGVDQRGEPVPSTQPYAEEDNRAR